MDHLHRYASAAAPIEACVVGSGGFGRSFLAQSTRVKSISARVAVDLTADLAAAAWLSIGIPDEQIARCTSADEAAAAWAAGQFIAAGDVATVLALPVQVLIEATGHP